MLSALKAQSFRYKDPANGNGPQLGVMAQNLERAGLKQAVVDTPRGKVVDTAKLTGANTAMLAAMQERLKKLEKDKQNLGSPSTADREQVRGIIGPKGR
jgi:hypothetical protein